MTWFTRLSAQSQGILFMIGSVSFFSLMDAVAKILGARLDLSQILWARYGGQLLLVLLLFGPRLPQLLRTDHMGLQIFRALMQLGAAGCFFTALRSIGLTEATAVADLAPILITLGAALILREHVGPRRITGILAALIGALIILRPGSSVFSPASLWPLGTALCLAGYALATRHIGQKESSLTALLYSGLICTAIAGLALPFRWVAPSSTEITLMLAIGGIGTLGQLLLIRAYATAEASAVAPFSYAGLLTATLWGFLIFGELPDLWTILGALVITLAGLYVWHRERHRTPPATETERG